MGSLTNAIMVAARNLRIPIPAPAIAKPKEKQSWRKLKVGQRLLNQQDMVIAGKKVPRLSVWTVNKCFSNGVTLDTLVGAVMVGYYLQEPEWEKWHFVRAGRTKATK